MSGQSLRRRGDRPGSVTIDLLAEHGRLRSLAELEHAIMREALVHCDYSPERAAEALGVGRSTFYRKLGDGSLGLCLLRPAREPARPVQEQILELLSEPRRAAELCQATGTSRQAVHTILETLIERGEVLRHTMTPLGRTRLFVRRRQAGG